MEEKGRWQKVAYFIEEMLKDESLRVRVRSADESERLELLYEFGFSRNDIKDLRSDFELLTPDMRPVIQFW